FSAPPVSGAPVSGQPYSAPPASGPPVSGAPAGYVPVSPGAYGAGTTNPDMYSPRTAGPGTYTPGPYGAGTAEPGTYGGRRTIPGTPHPFDAGPVPDGRRRSKGKRAVPIIAGLVVLVLLGALGYWLLHKKDGGTSGSTATGQSAGPTPGPSFFWLIEDHRVGSGACTGLAFGLYLVAAIIS